MCCKKMGNVLGTGHQQPGALNMNIAPGDQNDLNYPHSSQMFYFVLHGMIPLLGVCLFAYTAKQYDKDRINLENTCVRLNTFMNVASNASRAGEMGAPAGWALSKNDTSKLLTQLEDDEHRKMSRMLKEINMCDRQLDSILDIRCSLFKRAKQRHRLQEQMISHLTSPDHPLHTIDIYTGLKDIFRYDYLFCGENRKQNGKFRQLYIEKWKLQVELDKYKQLVERLKQQLKT